MADVTHLIGIGGVGMSALAQALLDKGCAVSGADRQIADSGTPPPTPVLRALAAQGVALFPDDGSGVDDGTARIIVSTAIEDTNPGLRKAKASGIPVVHRAAALAETLSGRKLVAVAGTCGKSTVTAILGHVLTACGFDPVVVNGAQIAGWDANGTRVGSVRKGAGEYAVAEVDESDKSLTAFSPYAAIITNASADHYSKEEMDAVFDAFIRDVPGPVIDGRVTAGAPAEAVAGLPMPGAHNRANARRRRRWRGSRCRARTTARTRDWRLRWHARSARIPRRPPPRWPRSPAWSAVSRELARFCAATVRSQSTTTTPTTPRSCTRCGRRSRTPSRAAWRRCGVRTATARCARCWNLWRRRSAT